jgi:hypothetical protein
MYFGTITSPTFIRNLGMVLYFGGGTKESIKVLRIQKKYRISRPIRRTFFPEKCDLN